MGVLDAWDTVRWAAENSIFLRADPERGFIVGGSSAGGNISAVLSHLSKSECLTPPLTGQWLSVPYLIPPTLVPEKYQSEYISMYGNKNDPVLGEFTPERLRGMSVQISAFSNFPTLVPKGCSDPSTNLYKSWKTLYKSQIQITHCIPRSPLLYTLPNRRSAMKIHSREHTFKLQA